MSERLTIPEEARVAGWGAFLAGAHLQLTGPEVYIRALEAAAPLIVAAELADDVGLSVLREMAAQVESDSAAMAFVGAFLCYADERDARAAELRGSSTHTTVQGEQP